MVTILCWTFWKGRPCIYLTFGRVERGKKEGSEIAENDEEGSEGIGEFVSCVGESSEVREERHGKRVD